MRLFTLALLAFALSTPADAYSKKEIDFWRKTFVRPAQIPYPTTNPYTAEKANLGELLFFDKRLSGNNQMACSTCHDPRRAWSDGRARGIGADGQELSRRVPTIENVAWGKSFFWDGRAQTLEQQATGPITNPHEMNQPLPELLAELKAIPTYVALFEKAFPGKGITETTLAQALATFERGVVTPETPFDRWVRGDDSAIPKAAREGFVLFNTKGRCTVCHDGWNFTDGSFADTGVDSDDPGMGAFDASPSIQHFFKTPGLRNAAQRAAFMHNGSLRSLEAVIDFYNQGGIRKRKTVSPDIRPLALTKSEKAALLTFLKTLTAPSIQRHLSNQ